jgi:eukaryotic-like serine/threonine-protein kinase
VLAQRFVLEALQGSGAMGSVYRARDLVEGETVAVKLLHGGVGSSMSLLRFAREARMLAQVQHSGIVSYLADGKTQQGLPYLVMEWLEGEDLAQRLIRQPLTVAESISLLRRVASALSDVHKLGIVHRDLKPSNLFLRNGEVHEATIVDFGIARRVDASMTLTNAGGIVGTPGYMAPEQARSSDDVGTAADIFSLGCVFYECLSRNAPFIARDIPTCLSRILHEEPTPLLELRPDLPESVVSLVERMLTKEAANRIPHGAALLKAIDELGQLSDLPAPSAPRSAGLGHAEQQLLTVVAVKWPSYSMALTLPGSDIREVARSPEIEQLVNGEAIIGHLADGSIALSFVHERSTALDQTVHAIDAASKIHARWPEVAITVSTGRGVLRNRVPSGEVIDRALRMFSDTDDSGRKLLVLDDVTAALVGGRILTAPVRHGVYTIVGEATVAVDGTRLLLGKATPCVGREHELSVLRAALDTSISESISRAVLVTGPPGIGKSRLRHEFVRRVLTGTAQVRVLVGRADPLRISSPSWLVGQTLRALFGVKAASPPAEVRDAIGAFVLQHPSLASNPKLPQLIRELCDVPSVEESSDPPQRDAALARAQIHAAFAEVIRAACSKQPVLMVLDDLQWADAASLALVDAAIRKSEKQPFMVGAFGRPEVNQRRRDLWRGRVQKIPLQPLSAQACTTLVKRVAGGLHETRVEEVVQQSGGNALFLEELLRSAMQQPTGKLRSEAVLVVLRARIARLEDPLRRLLRAASIFGESFSAEAIRAVLPQEDEVDQGLSVLEEEEVIERLGTANIDGDHVFRFRHSLMHEAAYGLLTESDRVLGHSLAATFLATHSSAREGIIGYHYLQARQWQMASTYLIRAASSAERAYALVEASSHLEGALEAMAQLPDTDDNARLRAHLITRLEEVSYFLTAPIVSHARLQQAESLAQRFGSSQPSREDLNRLAQVELGLSRNCSLRGDHNAGLEHAKRAIVLGEATGDLSAPAVARSYLGIITCAGGRMGEAETHFKEAIPMLQSLPDWPGWVLSTAYRALGLVLRGNREDAFASLKAAYERAIMLGHKRAIWQATTLPLIALVCSGQPEEACDPPRVPEEIDPRPEDLAYTLIQGTRAWALTRLGLHAEAASLREQARSTGRNWSGRFIFADWFAAAEGEMAVHSGHLDEARAIAERALEHARLLGSPMSQGLALRVLGDALMRSGERDSGERAMRSAAAAFEEAGAPVEVARTRLWHAERLDAAGAHEDARTLAARASGWLIGAEHARAAAVVAAGD